MPAASHILVVDDEPQVRDLTGRALHAGGFTCDLAADGEEAFRLASSTTFDAVVTDMRMPRRHGHALCLDLLQLPSPPPVMVLTALTDARLVRDLMGRGVYDVVQKPVNYDILATKIQAMIEFGQNRRVRAAPKARKKGAAKKVNLLHQIETSLIEMTDLFGERLDRVFDSNVELSEPPRSVRDYIRRLAESEATENERPQAVVLPGHEARNKDRVTCYTTAIAAPVNRRWELAGDPFKLALRDLSETGGRLLHTRATNAEYLALCWNATQIVSRQIRVVCQVRRCKPCGPFYDIGGQFVMAD